MKSKLSLKSQTSARHLVQDMWRAASCTFQECFFFYSFSSEKMDLGQLSDEALPYPTKIQYCLNSSGQPKLFYTIQKNTGCLFPAIRVLVLKVVKKTPQKTTQPSLNLHQAKVMTASNKLKAESQHFSLNATVSFQILFAGVVPATMKNTLSS